MVKIKERIALFSVFVNFFLALSKILVGFITNSVAVLSEGLHSGMDIFSSLISYIGIKISKKPSDKKHPYGHYKFEVFSGLIITAILLLTGIWIIYEAFLNFLNPKPIKEEYIALAVMLASAVVNEIMARIKIHYGKKENSMSLISDGFHSRVDVLTSLAVFLGVLLSTRWIFADSLLAFAIGAYILRESISLGKEATDSLLDASAGEEIEEKIKVIAKEKSIEISDLKTQKRGSAITANIEIKLPGSLSVEEATKVAEDLKNELTKRIENLVYVAIQIKSHETSTFFYKAPFGRGFGWQRRVRFKEKIPQAKGLGPGGYCVCPKCGYKVEHKRGVPCSTLTCPKCGKKLVREVV